MEIEEISYSQELLRKGIHLLSLTIPLIYIFVSKILLMNLIIPLLVITLLVDILSRKNMPLHNFFYSVFGNMLRAHEKTSKWFILNGASWVLISAVTVFYVFPKIVAVTAFTILIISDLMAALIGRRYGKNKLFDKSWEGTVAFILSSWMVVVVYYFIFNAPIYFLIFGIIAGMIGGFVEAASKLLRMDDNLSIPLSVGIIIWLGGFYALYQGSPYLDLLVK